MEVRGRGRTGEIVKLFGWPPNNAGDVVSISFNLMTTKTVAAWRAVGENVQLPKTYC